MMLVNYSSSSEDETEVLENAKRRQSCNNDDRLRKKHKPELEVPSHRYNENYMLFKLYIFNKWAHQNEKICAK